MTDAPPTSAGAPAGAPAAAPPGSFFDWIRGFGLRRSDDRWLAGVAGGIAAHTRLDPLIIRGILLVVAVLGGPVLFLYAVAWALLPDSQGRILLEQAITGFFEPAMIAVGVLIVLTFVPFMQGVWWRGVPDWWNMPDWLEATLRTGWILALAAGLVWLTVFLARRMPRTPAPGPTSHSGFWPGTADPGATPADAFPAPAASPAGQAGADAAPSSPQNAGTWYSSPAASHGGYGSATPGPTAADREAQRRQRDAARAEWRREHEERYRRRRLGAAYVSIALGLAVVAGAIAPVVAGYDGWSNAALVLGLAVALGVLALATIIAGIRGKESGALGFFSVLTVLAILFAGVFPAGTAVSVVGNTTWVVADAAERDPVGYAMVAGSPTLDLRGLDAPSAEVGGTVDLWLVAGSLDVVVPDDVPVVLEVHGLVAGLNYVDQDGDDRSRGGVFYRDEVRYGRTASSDTTTVRIWVVTGGVNVTEN